MTETDLDSRPDDQSAATPDNQRTRTPDRRPWIILLALIGLFVLARIVTAYATIFPDSGRVELLGADSYFHVRHAEYSMNHFPDLLRGDPGSHYPSVEYQAYSGLFNLSVAAITLALEPFGDTDRMLVSVSAWSPVVLAVLALVALFLVASSLLGRWGGVLAALIFLVYPGYSLSRTVLGFGDQHAAELMLAIGSVYGLAACVRKEHRAWYRPAILHALPFAAFFYTWIGAPMYVAFMGLAVFTMVVVSIWTMDTYSQIATGFFRFFSGVVFWQMLVVVFWPDLEMELVGGIHLLTVYAMIALGTLPYCYFRGVSYLSEKAIPRWILSAGTAILGVTLAYFFFTEHPRGQVFWSWLTNVRAQDVAEQEIVSWSRFWLTYGIPGGLAFASLPLALMTPDSKINRVLKVGLCMFGLSSILLWMHTHDFDYVPPVFIALLAVIAIRDLATWIKRFTRQISHPTMQGLVIPASQYALLILLILPIWPLGVSHVPWIREIEVEALLRHDDTWFDAMDWLRTHTPTPPVSPTTAINKTEPYAENTYGVMTTWDDGNFVAFAGRRLPTYSRYPSAGDALWLTAPTESEAQRHLCPGCREGEHVRYAVLSYTMASDLFLSKIVAASRTTEMQQEGLWNHEGKKVPRITFGDTFEKALVTRLFRDNGSGLEHYRLVYESSTRQLIQTVYDPTLPELRYAADRLPDGVIPPETGNHVLTRVGNRYIYDVHVAPSMRTYEIVTGAVLYGNVTPGEEISLSLDIASPATGTSYTYRQTVFSDSLGNFTFRIPYNTSAASDLSSIYPTGPYRLIRVAEHDTLTQAVSESQIQAGDSLLVDF